MIGTMGQVAAVQGLSVWVYIHDDSKCETWNVNYDDAWMSAYDGVHASRVALEGGTNATEGEEKGEAFDGALRMAWRGQGAKLAGWLFCRKIGCNTAQRISYQTSLFRNRLSIHLPLLP